MAKSQLYKVINNCLYFKCFFCQTKRVIAVPPEIRRKSVHCHKCGEISHCQLNRRTTLRESQTGKALMIFNDGRELPIDLYDISSTGVGFDLCSGSVRSASINQMVKLKCSWNPRLLDYSWFVIKNVNGRRVGCKVVR
jgi:hypothetical protein